ncbi:cytochrome c-type biogenesis protein [Asaia astilbis]|uniref:cytochrome c-type biogenesis protein n=1 Tax=Asaia astilbis TaxID=610244 RepID=UPI00046FA233
MKRLVLLSVLMLTVGIGVLPAYGLDSPSEMLPNPVQEKRAAAIGAQLRCLVCQNESIEDSSAALARDLRHVVRQHVASGESDQQIMVWMTQRYGEFIRLQPRLSLSTLLLWAMPVVAVLIGIMLAVMMLRRPNRTEPLSRDEAERLGVLLREGESRK